jgi:branched-chain amino acid transport system permease protein
MSWTLTNRANELKPSTALSLLRGCMLPCAFLFIALAAQLFLKPLLLNNGMDFTAKLIIDVGINIILAVSLTIVNGLTGQFSIGHAAFMAVGGYVAAAIVYYGSFRMGAEPMLLGGVLSGMLEREGDTPWFTRFDALFAGAILAGGLFAALCGYVVGLPSLRLKGDYLAIVTLGFGEIVRVLIQSQTEDVLYDADEIASTPAYALSTKLGGSLGFSGLPFYTSMFWVFAVCFATLLVAWRIKNSTYGRAFLSIREDEIAAESMGVNTTKFKVRAFVLSAFFAGCAGALYAHNLGVTLNAGELGFVKSFDIIIMVVLGGLGSISGAVIAAVILTLLPEYLRDFAQYRMIVYAVLLIVMMIVRPKGLLGVHELWERGAWGWFTRKKVAKRTNTGGAR